MHQKTKITLTTSQTKEILPHNNTTQNNQAFQNGSFKTVSNKDIEGKWALFFFYPADFTFVCPTELEDLQSKYDELRGMGVEVFSVSTDSHFVHKAWHDTSDRIAKLQYTMLADPLAVLSRGFGVAAPSSSTRKDKSNWLRFRITALAATPTNSSARCRLHSM